MAGGLTQGTLVTNAIVGYGMASFFSYRYNLITKAQMDLKDIKDKKGHLLKTHDNLAESYDKSSE